jgi:TPR repeat protein
MENWMNTGRILTFCLSATLAGAALSQRVFADSPPIVSSAAETTLQQGIDFARKHEFTKALDLWRPLAEQGNPKAQTYVGEIYSEGGFGVPKDEAQALAWYRKAADQGLAEAQNHLGNMYSNGRAVAKDETQAVAWYRKAADQGDADAQYNLGYMYANGRGVAKDETQAIAWYRKAADQGDADAQYNLGLNYTNGKGVAKDEAQAVSWYRKAADQGYANAELNLGTMYGKGQGVQQSYAQAALWFARAAQKGDDTAVRNLELAVDKLPTLRMRASVPVRANPEPTGAVVKTAVAGEVAYRLSQFDNWYEVYFRDRNIVGYINTAQASVVVADIPQPAASPIRKAAYVEPSSNFPAAPATRPGVTSCNTRCNNGQCLRTYDSGKHVAFQAEHKFNAFNNEWEWDSGTC